MRIFGFLLLSASALLAQLKPIDLGAAKSGDSAALPGRWCTLDTSEPRGNETLTVEI